MGRQVDGDPRRRGSGGAAGLPDRPPPVSVAYDPPPPPRQARGSAKMKMESLIAAVDSTEPMLQFPDADAAKSRRKRAKKTREDDDWRPARYESVEYAAAPARAMAPASILNPAPPEAQTTSAINDARNGNAYQYQVETVAPQQMMASVFHEMPVIQSFAETERRRAGLDGPGGVSATAASTVAMPQVVAEPSRSAAAVGQSESLNGGLPAASRNGPATVTNGLSVFEVYFPFARSASGEFASGREQEPNGSTGNGRSLKRKRRNETGSGRPSRRSGKEDDASGVSKYDLLRFDVDSIKLVPQGLVDRVEPKMSSAFIAKVIRSHVDNWCRRSGFGNNFLSEVTTLLTAYYPCNYPTLLDEVLAGFLFTCPEYIDKFLPHMIAKYHKTAESVTSAKHPVIDAFARQCQSVRGSYETRHDLACLTLLRCLVERNTEKFLLSPSIAICAVECSDAALGRFWRALLSAMRLNGVSDEGDDAAPAWNVYEPSHQVYELLMFDDKLRSRYAPDSRRISESFVRAVLFNRSVKSQVIASYSDLLQLALSGIFADARTAWTTSLFNDWVAESARVEPDAPAFPLEDLIKLLLEFCANVSTQKTNWFANHILGYVLSEQYPSKHRERALSEIIRRYMPLLLGAAPAEDTKYVDLFRNRSVGGEDNKDSSEEAARKESVKTPAGSEKASRTAIAERLERLLSFLATCDEKCGALFLKLWATAWTDGSDTTIEPLAWSYIRALMLVLIRVSTDQGPAESSRSLKVMFCDLAERTASAFFRRLQVATKNEERVLPQATEILNESLELLLSTGGKAVQRVLFDVVNVLRACPGGASMLCNAVKLLLDDRSQDPSFNVQTTKQRTDTSKNSTDCPQSPTSVESQLRGTFGAVQANTLASLLALVTRAKKHTTAFVRTQLSSPSLVRFLVAKLETWQRRHRATFTRQILALMQMVDAVVSSSERGAPYTIAWAQPYVVQDVVKFAYIGPHDVSVRAVIILRNAVAQSHGANAERALWEVLRQCTKTCCGCSSTAGKENDPSWPALDAQAPRDATVAMFAELVGAMILSGPESTLAQVGSYVEANILSCLAGETRVNLFLLTLVQRVVQDTAANTRWSSLVPVVQVGVSSLAIAGSDRIRVLQLQVLRAVCSRVLVLTQSSNSVSSRAGGGRIEVAKKAKATTKQQRQAADEVAQWRRLLCSERVQSDLRAVVATTSSSASNGERCSRAAIELARGVLTLSARVEKLAQV